MPVQLPDDRPLLLFCGFARSYKGLDILLNALPSVLEKRKVHLLVAREFWEGDLDYRSEISELGLDDAVTIIDQYLPNELLATCVERAAVVVLPYRKATQRGIVQLAFGKNTPVITTEVYGLAEVVHQGKTGLVVPPGDSQALAAAINQFFEEGLGREFASNIEDEKDRFEQDNLVEILGDLAR
jgi:glycosyltransferase involved in cell wall biosynthesis